MPKLIKDSEIIEDSWTWLDATDEPSTVLVPNNPVIVPLAVWQAQKEQLSQRKDTLGVWLNSHEAADQLGDDAQGLGVIALYFHAFMDGRLFSAARLFRERYGFTGELRASGHFIRDQLFYLKRCGVNAFSFANSDIVLEECLPSLGDFSDCYQAACDQPLPLFRRRA